MSHRAWSLAALASFAVFGSAGCALTEKGEARDVSYFAVEAEAKAVADSGVVPGADDHQRPKLLLRIGRVSASSHLGKRIVYRSSSVDFGMYLDRRWTERPDEYVRRSLAAALYDRRGVTQALAGAAPTLDIEVLGFEELRDGARRRGAVTIRFALQDEREVLLSDEIKIEANAASERPADIARAISAALAQASAQIADRVAERLTETATEPAKKGDQPL